MKTVIVGAAVGFAALLLMFVLIGVVTSPDRPSRTGSDPLADARISPVPMTTPVSECEAAYPALVDQIAATLTRSSFLASGVQMVTTVGGTYVGGNIMQGDGVASHGDVWFSKGGTLYALSSGAREFSTAPDGRDLASAGDEYGSQLIECVT